MEIGKVSEVVLRRSVLNQLGKRRREVLVRPGIGEDCAIMKLDGDECVALSTDPITGTVHDVGALAVHITVNDLASSGAEAVGLLMTVILPPHVEEEELKRLVGEVESECDALGVEIVGGHTEVSTAVNQPLVSMTGIGKVKKDGLVTTAGAKPNQDLVLTKWTGLEGTSILANEKEETLLERLPKGLVESAKAMREYLSVVPEAGIACAHGVGAMHDVTEGGVFGALWEMASASNVGFEVEIKKIPIKQETVEICEVLDVNPYRLISSGCLLIATDGGHDLVEQLGQAGITAAVIGRTVEGKGKCVWNEGVCSHLGPPEGDELYKTLQVKKGE